MPHCFSKKLGFGGFVLCSRFYIFDKPILEGYVS